MQTPQLRQSRFRLHYSSNWLWFAISRRRYDESARCSFFLFGASVFWFRRLPWSGRGGHVRRPAFQRCIEQNRSVLQLMAMYFRVYARRRLSINRVIDGVALSPRELECLEWAAQGKSAWEIGRLLNISRRTAAFHLDNAKTKFGVRTICQAVAKLAASKATTE
jgi:DNA-binding CsgD family transcriptional regulator